jgi:predicted component of type VI protein secretion system
MPAQLVALNDGPSIWLDKPILLLGRHPECDIQIDSRKVSRRHCCIAQVSDYLVVRDLGSTNGIRINGVRVQEGRLAPGDELTIGNHRFRVSWESVAPLPRPPAPFKDTLRSALPADEVADDLLESCDEPMALAEPAARPRPPGVPPQRRTDLVPPSPPPPSRGPDPGASLIVPDDLRLLPSSSDVYPSHPSGSHHPPA